MKSINQLQKGEECSIIKLEESPYIQRLMALGFVQGKQVQMVRRSPFGGGVYLLLANIQVALRTQEAQTIIVS